MQQIRLRRRCNAVKHKQVDRPRGVAQRCPSKASNTVKTESGTPVYKQNGLGETLRSPSPVGL